MNLRKNLEVNLIITLLSTFYQFAGAGRFADNVTCGSFLKLFNSSYKIRLHSHNIKYNSGSGQQSVTGIEAHDDANSHWLVKGTPKDPCKRGEVIRCGMVVRLEHGSSKKNLHSHNFQSPLSSSQEISAFGDNGEGDTGDFWTVVCDGDYWSREDSIQFKHVDTEMYLGLSGHTYGSPVHGQMEIVGISRPNVSSKWKVLEGVYINPVEQVASSQHSYAHSEL